MADGRSSIFCSINLNIRSSMLFECASCVPLLRAKEEISMAREVGQIIARGDRRCSSGSAEILLSAECSSTSSFGIVLFTRGS
jgi:hypothetical protein